jgi:hypothetical protein
LYGDAHFSRNRESARAVEINEVATTRSTDNFGKCGRKGIP